MEDFNIDLMSLVSTNQNRKDILFYALFRMSYVFALRVFLECPLVMD